LRAFFQHYQLYRLAALTMVLVLNVPVKTTAAQDTAPDLRAAKSQMQRQLVAAVLPEKKAYREQLVVLEKKLAQGQDFAQAIKVRDERVALEREIAVLEKDQSSNPKTVTPAPPERIELNCANAQLNGVQWDSTNGCLVGWDKPQATAVWNLPDLPPGGYEIVLSQTSHGGEIALKESFYSLKAALKQAKDKPVEQNLGTLRIRDGKGTLSLAANSSELGASLRVYTVALLPAAH
jgi:hypothetical protein